MKIASLFILAAFAQELSTDRDLTNGAQMKYNNKTPNYLSMELPFKPADSLRKQLEQQINAPLKNRGEAHITVITPVEFNKVLKSKISMQEIHQLAVENQIQQADVKAICVGVGEKKEQSNTLSTYYVVVESNKLLALRKKVQELYLSRGGEEKAFQADQFYPHITLGFTVRDLHLESDGVVKNSESCRFNLKLN